MFEEVNITCPQCGHRFEHPRELYQSGVLFHCENIQCQTVLSKNVVSIQDDLKDTSIRCPDCRCVSLVDLNTVKTFNCPNCSGFIF